MAFTYREGLGRPLTYQEMDDNLEYVEALAQHSEAMSDSAGTSAAQAAQDAAISQQARDEAVQAAAGMADAASLTPEPGKIPLADGEGVIDIEWLGMSASGKVVATGTPAQGRTALGLGTAAVANAEDFDPAGSAANALSSANSYTDSLVGDIGAALDAINGEVV